MCLGCFVIIERTKRNDSCKVEVPVASKWSMNYRFCWRDWVLGNSVLLCFTQITDFSAWFIRFQFHLVLSLDERVGDEKVWIKSDRFHYISVLLGQICVGRALRFGFIGLWSNSIENFRLSLKFDNPLSPIQTDSIT